MKKTLFALFLLLSVSGIGQNSLYFGLGGYYGASGVINQNAYGMPELNYDVPSSYGYNLNIGYAITGHLGVKAEIGMSRLGQKYHDTRGDTSFAREIRLNYLMVPVLFKYNSSGKTVRFCVLAGPQMGFLTSATQDYTWRTTSMSDPVPYNRYALDKDDLPFNVSDEDIKERISSFELMARLDLGVDITLVKNLVLNAGVTMCYGLLDINAPAYRLDDFSGNYNPSHNFSGGIGIGLNYYIPLGK